jgi:hypothetical protein
LGCSATQGDDPVPTKMYIYGEAGLWSSRGPPSEFELERALDNFLQDRGEVIWDGDEHRGPPWNVDLLLHGEAHDVDAWVERLAAFLLGWGVQDSTLNFTIIREGTPPTWEHRRVEIARK